MMIMTKQELIGVEPIHNVLARPISSNFRNRLNGLQGILSKIPVVSLWPITLPFKFKCRILNNSVCIYVSNSKIQ